ncbi:MAG: tape measure protein [Oscillospiraceae bacterium]|nr:tape measure protein [Oscillospiraceae bacterium]
MATISEFINKIGFKVKDGDVDKVNSTIAGIKDTASKVLGVIGIGFSLTAINGLVEEFSRVKSQINNSTAGLGEQADIQDKILAAATKTRTEYAQTAGMVSNLVKENSELFGTVDEAIKFNNAATMLFKTAGKTNEDIAGLMEAINKSFAKGYVDSETISQLLERSPEAVELLNRKLGTTSDQLEQMASDGKFTVADLKAAFVDNADVIEEAYGSMKMNVTDAITVIRNKWGLWLADTNEMLNITHTIGTVMVSAFDGTMRVVTKVRTGIIWLSEKLGGMQNLMRLIAIVAGAIFLAMNFSKIMSGLQSIGKLLTAINWKMLGIIAVIILVALLVDDFINFLMGNNSVLGTLLEQAGIDVEAVRETIINAWGAIQSFLGSCWETIKSICTTIWGSIKDFFAENGETIMADLSSIWESIKTLLIAAWELIKAIAITVFTNLVEFWNTWGGTIMTFFADLWEVIKAVFIAALDILAAVFAVFAALFSGNWSELWNSVKNLLSAIWTGIQTILTTVLNAIWNVISSVFSVIWGYISGVAQNIWSKLTTTFSNILSSITATVGNIRNAIVQGFTSAVNWITSLPAQALTWGKHIIDNIIQGIKNAIGRLISTMSNVASTIRSYIGFSEPETGPLSNFHTYMPDMIDLMTQGIEAGRSKVKGALGNIAGDMSIMAQSGRVSGMTAGAVTSSSVQKSIVQNVEINNQFHGDSAIQQKASTAMKKSGADVTAEMARALAYGK